MGEHTPLGNEENGLELELALDGEMLDSKVLFPVVGQTLVERTIFLRSDVLWIPRPNGLGLVEFLVLDRDFLDLLLLFRLFLVLIFDFLDLGLLLAFIGFFADFGLFLVIFNFLKMDQNSVCWVGKENVIGHLLNLLGNSELNGIRDEFGVLLDDILYLFLLKVFKLILLEVEADLGTTTERGAFSVGGDGKSSTSGRLPDVLLVVVVLGDDLHAFSDEVGRVETDTELANHGNVGTGAHSLHETLQRVLDVE